jgi:hypothetical protein
VAERTMYMHLLDGAPGTFDGEQICFAATGAHSGRRSGALLVPTLAQVKREQRESARYRQRLGLGVLGDYSYVRVEAPDAR